MMRVLVLGSSGRIGTMLRRSWSQDAAHHADITFVYQTRHRQPLHTDDPVWDVSGPPSDAVRAESPFDCMIVLSGIVPKPDADFTLNSTIGLAALDAAIQLDIPRVLLASTSAVYGNYSDTPLNESDPLAPVNDYGRSKKAMEEACQTQARATGIDLCCLRIGNVAGADALLLNGAGLSPDEALRLDSFSDGGTPVRSYIGPQSLGRVLVSLVRAGEALPDALNIATPHAITMGALAQAAHMPVILHRAKDATHQNITLDCTALTALHQFGTVEAEPQEMVRQWQALRMACRMISGQ